MARVEVKKTRIQPSSFALYRTSAGGDESFIVRRKVGEPTDVSHTKSRKLKRQRDNFTLASQHYSRLSPSQKAITRHQIEEVEYQKSHGKTDTKLLVGRQLFISKEMHSLTTTQKQLVLPHEHCIMLTDPGLNPLEGELWLSYLKAGEWHDIKKEELYTGSWLFSQVPKGQEAYRVYGESVGFFDPQLSEHQYMSEEYLLTHHYQKLFPAEPRYGYSFASRYWVFSHGITPNITHSTLHIHSEMQMFDFTGQLTIALWRLGYPYPPEGEICRQTYHISAGVPDPKHLYTTFSGLSLIKGVPYWMRHWRDDFSYDLWMGIIHFWEIS